MRGISETTNLGLLNERSVISGVIQPGSTELTRMRWRANSTASDRIGETGINPAQGRDRRDKSGIDLRCNPFPREADSA